MPPSPPTDLPSRAFPSISSFEAFLDREHESAPGVYVKLAKKASGIPSITKEEAVEVALCFGWIDGRGNSIDDKWWTVRYQPRRAKSIWSKKNVDTIARLTEEGRMRPAGLAAVEAAKADGQWERAYAGPATMTTPDDFAALLAAEPAAEAYFESLSKMDRYMILMRLVTVSDKNRVKKMDALVQSMAVGNNPLLAKTKSVKSLPKKTSTKGVKKVKVVKKSEAGDAPVKVEKSTAEDRPRREGLRKRP